MRAELLHGLRSIDKLENAPTFRLTNRPTLNDLDRIAQQNRSLRVVHVKLGSTAHVLAISGVLDQATYGNSDGFVSLGRNHRTS